MGVLKFYVRRNIWSGIQPVQDYIHSEISKKISIFSLVHYHADRHSGCSKLLDFSDSSRVLIEDTILFDLILDLHGIFDPVWPDHAKQFHWCTLHINVCHLPSFLCVISTVVSIVTISTQLKSDKITRVVPSENSDVLRMDHDQRDQCQEYWKFSPRKTFSRSDCKEVILNKIDTFMLVTNFILLGISAFILTVCYLS